MKEPTPIIEYGVPIDAQTIIEPPDAPELELEPGHPGLGQPGPGRSSVLPEPSTCFDQQPEPDTHHQRPDPGQEGSRLSPHSHRARSRSDDSHS